MADALTKPPWAAAHLLCSHDRNLPPTEYHEVKRLVCRGPRLFEAENAVWVVCYALSSCHPPHPLRGKEIAFSVTKKLRLCYGVDQTPRQITTIWHVVLSVSQFADFESSICYQS